MSIIKQDYGELSSGGEQYEETLLWENPNPTSNFAQQAVTLSDDINNYDYISVEYKSSKPATIASKVIIPVNDFKAYSGTTASASDGNKGFRWFIGSRYQDGSNTYGYVRYVSYTSDTSITITNGYALGTTTTSVQTVVIPYKIYGVKKVGGLSETILWENTNLGATSFPNQNITLSNGNFAYYE